MTVGASVDVYFTVHNTGTVADDFDLSGVGAGSVTCEYVTPSLPLEPGQDRQVLVRVRVLQAGTGTITVTAASDSVPSVTDDGFRNFTASVGTIFTAHMTTEANYLRARCVATSHGPVTMQCGDAVAAYATPPYRSFNKPRSTTLLYNSQTVRPTPIAVVDFTTLPGETISGSITLNVRVRVGGTPILMAQKSYGTGGFNSSITEIHRFTAAIDAVAQGLATGGYPYSIELVVPGRPTYVATGTVVIVDRRQSVFGAGWGLAGVERLYRQADGALVVYGDGSAQFYRKVGSSYVAPPGVRDALTYDGGTTRFTRTVAGGYVVVKYNANDRSDTVVVDRLGNKAVIQWASSAVEGWRVASLTDVGGQVTQLSYDGAGYLSAIQQPGLGSIGVTTAYNGTTGRYRLTGITEPDGVVTSYGYEATRDYLTSVTARGLGAYTPAYDFALGRLRAVGKPAGRDSLIPAEREGSVTAGLAPNAKLTFLRPRGGGYDSLVFRLDRWGQPTTYWDFNGHSTTIERDSVGLPVHILTAYAPMEAWNEYTGATLLLARTILPGDTGLRDTTHYTWNTTLRQPTQVRSQLGVTTTYGYDPTTGLVTAVTDGMGRQTTLAYNARGQLEAVKEPTEAAVSYDSLIYQPAAPWNLIRYRTPAGSTAYGYQANNVIPWSVEPPEDIRTEYTYDPVLRPLTVVERALHGLEVQTTTFAYDDAQRWRKQWAPGGRFTQWTFDAQGRMTQRCSAGQCETHNYLDGVNRTSVTTRRGQPLYFEYNAAGWVTKKTIGASWSSDYDSVLVGYNPDGKPISIASKYSWITRSYDFRGRLAREQYRVRGETWIPEANSYDWHVLTVSHRYDRDDRRVASYYTEPVGWTEPDCTPFPDDPSCAYEFWPIYGDSVGYQFDNAGALTTTWNSLWRLTAGATDKTDWRFTFDGKGRPYQQLIPLPSSYGTITTQFDGADRVTSRTIPTALGGGTETLQYLGYGSQITQHNALGLLWDYTYDGLNRLKTETKGGNQENAYTYDAGGNRATDWTWTYDYDAQGRLNYKTRVDCTVDYAYDLSGNTVTEDRGSCSDLAGRTALFDAAERMFTSTTTVTDYQGTRDEGRTYRYDGEGRLIQIASTHFLASDYGITRFFWLDDQVAVKTWNQSSLPDLWKPALGRDGNGTVAAEGEWFFYGPGLDNVIASLNHRGTGHRHLFIKDRQGSVQRVLEGNGSSHGYAGPVYGPFGRGGGDIAKNGPGYTGLPSVAGLVYMRNRWYDPNSGRFTQEDPIGYAGGINLYAYVGNNPVSYTDPFGLCPYGKKERDENVDDCPKDKLGNSFRFLARYGGDDGKQ